MNDKIFLVGYRGAGKTTVGQHLARRLRYGFIDTDQFICKREGKSIRALVDECGWDAFRRREEAVLRELAGKKRHVIATGGGAILHQSAWKRLRETSVVIWLAPGKDILRKRLAGDDSADDMRPPLTEREVEEMPLVREPLYGATSHLRIDTGRMSPEETVQMIMAKISSFREKEE